jgi:Nucleoside-diphosphate-sugar epimerases
MTRLLITGIGGFTGRHLLQYAQARGFEIFGLGHRGDCDVEGLSKKYAVDLADLSKLKRIAIEVKPDYVVHLAGAAFVGRPDVEAFYKTNIVGTRNLLDALSSTECAPKGVLLASSANVYGNLRPGEISELMEPDPANDYGVSKLAMEFVARIFRRHLPIIVTRPFNYTGVGQSSDFLIPKIIDHLKRKAPRIRLGNLDIARDFSDVRDVVRAYVELLGNPRAVGETVNICSGQAYKLGEILKIAQDLACHNFQVDVDVSLIRANEIRALWGDRSKLNALLGRSEITPLPETINWMLTS